MCLSVFEVNDSSTLRGTRGPILIVFPTFWRMCVSSLPFSFDVVLLIHEGVTTTNDLLSSADKRVESDLGKATREQWTVAEDVESF